MVFMSKKLRWPRRDKAHSCSWLPARPQDRSEPTAEYTSRHCAMIDCLIMSDGVCPEIIEMRMPKDSGAPEVTDQGCCMFVGRDNAEVRF